MAKRRNNESDLIAETMQRLRSASRRICNQRDLDVEIDPEFEAASCQDRVEMLYSSLGEMPTASSYIVRIDTSKPWGPGNLCWSKQANKVKTLHAGDWSPTAQCESCKGFRTKITGTDTVRGIRWHRCECGRQFETEMLDLADYEHRTTAGESLTHDGITQTIRAWALQRNMLPETLRARLRSGWTIDKALNTRVERHLPRPEKLTFNGITQSVEQWASDLGVNSSTIHARISRGLSEQDALRTSGRLPSPKTVGKNQTPQRHRSNRSMLSCNGRTQSVAAWSTETGISDALIRRRLKLGWSVERTLKTPASPRRMLTWRGRTQSVAQWARELGISLQLIAHRLRRGWKASEIFETPVGVPRKKSGGDQK